MTTVYFVRHAQPNFNNHDDMTRELSQKGMADSLLVTRFLADKNVDVVYSSPFKRAVDTVRDFADSCNLEIKIEDDFRERKVSDGWIEDFAAFTRRQWEDFDYKMPDGESLREVQNRNITVLKRLLSEYREKVIVIGTHGTALSTMINYYDGKFGYEDFRKINFIMPWVVKMQFQGESCESIQSCLEIK